MESHKKKEQLRLRRLIYGTFSASTKLPSYPDGGNKIIDIEIVYRPVFGFGNLLNKTATGVYILLAKQRMFEKSVVVRKLTL